MRRHKSEVSKEKRSRGTVFCSPIAMNKCMVGEFGSRDWEEQRTACWVTEDAKLIEKTMKLRPLNRRKRLRPLERVRFLSYNQTDFVKDRIAVEVQFNKFSFVAYDLFVKHMAFYIGNVIDVGVEILAMKSLQKEMTSGVGYYEGELYNLIRESRGVPAVPLVLIGVAP
jgi:hypothetical protein